MYLYYYIDNIMKIDNLNKRCLQKKKSKKLKLNILRIFIYYESFLLFG